jgi:hypothetical protein
VFIDEFVTKLAEYYSEPETGSNEPTLPVPDAKNEKAKVERLKG